MNKNKRRNHQVLTHAPWKQVMNTLLAVVLCVGLTPTVPAAYAEEEARDAAATVLTTSPQAAESDQEQAAEPDQEQAAELNSQELEQTEPVQSQAAESEQQAPGAQLFAASPTDDGQYGNGMNVRLLYADRGGNAVHPEGDETFTASPYTLFANISVTGNITQVENEEIKIYVPAQYLQSALVLTPPSASASWGMGTITSVQEGDYYVVTLPVNQMDNTAQTELQLMVDFEDYVVPTDYELDIHATASNGANENRSNTLTLKPKYNTYYIDKYANNISAVANRQDHVNTPVSYKTGADDVPYLDGTEKVYFRFRLNNTTPTSSGSSAPSVANYRSCDEITLTDTLPTYTDRDGNTRTATFSPAENPVGDFVPGSTSQI